MAMRIRLVAYGVKGASHRATVRFSMIEHAHGLSRTLR